MTACLYLVDNKYKQQNTLIKKLSQSSFSCLLERIVALHLSHTVVNSINSNIYSFILCLTEEKTPFFEQVLHQRPITRHLLSISVHIVQHKAEQLWNTVWYNKTTNKQFVITNEYKENHWNTKLKMNVKTEFMKYAFKHDLQQGVFSLCFQK